MALQDLADANAIANLTDTRLEGLRSARYPDTSVGSSRQAQTNVFVTFPRGTRERRIITVRRAGGACRKGKGVRMGLIARFLSGYTENFLVAVALWPLASAALTLPILAWLYHRDGRLRFGSAVSTYLAVLYVLGLGCFTL